jgi:hypothetical protein
VITHQMVCASPAHAFGAASKLHRLVGVSAALAGDAAFPRQIRQKFL